MSDYEVNMPDGRRVSVSANTPEEAASAARNFTAREKGGEQGKAGGVDNFARSFARGVPLAGGFADEFSAAMDAIVGPHVDTVLGKLGLGSTNTSTQPDLSGRYAENLARERGQDSGYDAAHPVWSTAGKLGGAVLGTVAGARAMPALAPALAPAKTVVGNIVKGAGTGAVLGGVAGFGEGEGGFTERAKDAGKGAAVGGGAGAVLAPVAGVVGNGVRYVAESKFGQGVADVRQRIAEALGASAPVRALSAGGTGETVQGRTVINRLGDALQGKGTPGAEGVLERGSYHRIADELNRGGGTVPEAQRFVEGLGPAAMILDANTPQLQRLGRTAYTAPGPASKTIDARFEARQDATGPRVRAKVNEAMGDPTNAVDTAEALKLQRATGAGMNYGESNAAGLTISDEMQAIMGRSSRLRDAVKAMQDDAGETGRQMSPVEIMHKVKRILNSEAEAKYGASDPRAANAGHLADEFESALHKANPKLQAADEAFQKASAPLDALKLGRDFLKQAGNEAGDAVSVAALNKKIPLFSPEEKQAFIAGAADELNRRAASPEGGRAAAKIIASNDDVKAKLTTLLGKDTADKLFASAKAEKVFAKTERTVSGGSDSVSKAQSAADFAMGGPPTTMGSLAGKAWDAVQGAYIRGRSGNEAVRGRIADILTDPNTQNVPEHFRRIAAALAEAQKARGVQRGVSGAAGGEAARNF